MTVGTVGTYQLFQSTLNNVDTVSNNLTDEQEQLSSGNQYQSFAEMSASGQTTQYLDAGDAADRISQYLNDHQPVEAIVNTTSTVLSQVITTATNLQSLISQQMSGTTGNNAFGDQLNGVWQEFVGQANTQVDNQYIFSGSATNTPAVSNTTFPTLQVSGAPDLGYYQGNQQEMTTRVDDNTVITYNVTAGNPAFQKIFAGLAMAQQAAQSSNTDDYEQAETLIQQGISGLTELQSVVGTTAQQLTTSDTDLNNQKLYYQGLQQTLGNTDIVSVSTQVAENEGILQAAFQAFSGINSLFKEFASILQTA